MGGDEQRDGPRTVRFGVFEADLDGGELRREGTLVKLQGQPFRLLALLLEHPGAIVTREELRAALWPDGSFVDFEYGVNTAIKKLRYALGDSGDNPRFIQTLPRKGYRFIAPVSPDGPLQPPVDVPCVGASPKRRWTWIIAAALRRGVRLWWWLAAAAACMVSLTVGWRLHEPLSALAPWKLSQLTNDAGLSSAPAMSHDGKLLSYSSDRGLEGGQDVYIRQIAGGQPIRRTAARSCSSRRGREAASTRFRRLAARCDSWRGVD